MHTAPTTRPDPARRPAFDRFADWILDRDGTIYGDERERLRWYEGIAVAASVQWLLVPWVLAVMAWICPAEAAPYLWVVFLAFLLPMSLATIYVMRRRVDLAASQRANLRTRKTRVTLALTALPIVIFVLGLTLGLDLREGTDGDDIQRGLGGGLIGGIVGAAIAVVLIRALHRRAAAADQADDD
jgi:hypothetical protein